jgi:DNA modification methylase
MDAPKHITGLFEDAARNAAPLSRKRANAEANKLSPEDKAAHDWYRFVLSFPPHLVREYVNRFGLDRKHVLLDPFAGTGTTLVEGKKLGVTSVGIEANPMAHFASEVKTDWKPDPDELLTHANLVSVSAKAELDAFGIVEDLPVGPLWAPAAHGNYHTLPEQAYKLLLKGSISPRPLHKTLVLLRALEAHRDERFYRHERLALAKSLVSTVGNLHFGPEVGVSPPKEDAPVIASWFECVQRMAHDLRQLNELHDTSTQVHFGDARCALEILGPSSVDAVITSPPYPNEKDYTRTTRLESVLLGFLKDGNDLRELKKGLLRSNTRNVYKGDDDDRWIASHPQIQCLSEKIEERRIELGKTSGFEKLYAKVTKLYFGGMKRHLEAMRRVLKPGAHLAYVVGDQASYLRVMIRTGQLLGEIAESLGYELISIDLFRTRLATATKEQLNEEVVVFRWTGPGAGL